MTDTELDGGLTIGPGGKRLRKVLDARGVYLRHESADDAPAPAPTALDAASEIARTTVPAALTMTPPEDAPPAAVGLVPPSEGAGVPAGAPGSQFQAPT